MLKEEIETVGKWKVTRKTKKLFPLFRHLKKGTRIGNISVRYKEGDFPDLQDGICKYGNVDNNLFLAISLEDTKETRDMILKAFKLDPKIYSYESIIDRKYAK